MFPMLHAFPEVTQRGPYPKWHSPTTSAAHSTRSAPTASTRRSMRPITLSLRGNEISSSSLGSTSRRSLNLHGENTSDMKQSRVSPSGKHQTAFEGYSVVEWSRLVPICSLLSEGTLRRFAVLFCLSLPEESFFLCFSKT